MAKPYIVVRANIAPEIMEEFVRWYRGEHLQHVMAIPGVVRAYRSTCHRKGTNWTTLYELKDDASIPGALSSAQATRAREDWQRWLEHVSELTVEVYANLGPLIAYHHWN